MARKPKTEEVIVDENVTVDKKTEAKADAKVEVDVKGSAVKESEKPQKNVRIKLSTNHRCCIGGEWYNFQAGTCYNVPASVKEILMRVEGLLLPL